MMGQPLLDTRTRSSNNIALLRAKALIILLILFIPWLIFNIAAMHVLFNEPKMNNVRETQGGDPRNSFQYNSLQQQLHLPRGCGGGGGDAAITQLKHQPRHHHDDHADVCANKILVVYAGPNSKSSKKAELYKRNLEYFLKHGVDCATQDTVIVVGHEFYNEYLPVINRLRAHDAHCQSYKGGGNGIMLIARRNVCYDMEAARLVLFGGAPGMEISSYDYFFFANCGTTGPYQPQQSANGAVPSSSWTSHFTNLLNDQVKMTGLSMNCENPNNPHIQSMMYALDRVGLNLVMKSGAIFDCLDPPNIDFINGYERKMGHAIMDAGYAIQPLIGGKDMILTTENKMECVPCKEDRMNDTDITPSCKKRDFFRDIWIESRLKSIYDGRVPSLEDTIFFKTSRLLPFEIAAEINYTGKIDWNWE